MPLCPINQGNRDSLENFHVNALVTLMEEGQPLDLQNYLTSFYKRLLIPRKDGSIRDKDQALSYIHISPSIIRQVLRSDPQMETYFVDKGLDLNSIVKLDGLFTRSNTPLNTALEYVGAPDDIISQIAQQKTIVNKVAQESGFSPGSASVGESKSFRAAPLSANTTTGQEALPDETPNPSRATRYAFQRKVINDILTDSSQLNYPYGGIWLTAMHSSKIADYKGPDTVLWVVTDSDSNTLSLNAEGKFDGPREVMYYPSREVTKSGDTYSSHTELAPLSAVVKQYANMGKAITIKDAEAIRQSQLKQAYDIQQYIKKDPGNILQTVITGGSMGYTTYGQSIRTPLGSVNLDAPLLVEIQKDKDGPFFDSAAYFRIKGIQDPILLQRNEMSSELIDKIASTFVDPIYESHAGDTYLIRPLKRLQLIKQYLSNTGPLMTTLEKGELILHINDIPVDLTDTENARKQITDYFNTYAPTPGFDENTLTDEKRTGALKESDPDFLSKLRQGIIVAKTSQDGVFYEKYTKPAFNINNDFIKNTLFDDYSLDKHLDGFLINSNPVKYYNWLKKNTYVNYELNKDGKILALNSYFIYKLTDEAKDKLYPKEEVPTQTAPSNPGVTEQGSTDTQDADDAVRSFIDRIQKEGLRKTIDQKFFNIPATKEQIEQAKVWYNNHPLSKYLPFSEMFNIVNSGSVATWTTDGITLFHGSDYSDLYHEAWHGFSQGFLTRKQKQSLYGEVRTRSGSFTTYAGKRVTFRKASYMEVEEFLAEDFRRYMLSGGKTLSSPTRNSIFRRVLNFLKALFGNTTQAQMLINQQSVNTIRDLYEKLRVGNINSTEFSVNNAIFGRLNKGLVAIDNTDPIAELSSDESIIAVHTVDSIFSTFIDEYNKTNPDNRITNHVFSTDRGRQIAYEEVLKELAKTRKALFWKNTHESDPQIKNLNQRNLDTLDYMIRHFGDPKDPRGDKQKDKQGNPIGLIAYHNRKSEFLSFEDKYLADDNNTPESWAFKDGNEVSLYDRGKSTIWYLIKGLHRTDENNDVVLNRLGFPELVDFDSVRRRLTKLLAGSLYENMQQILIDNKERYPYIKQLLEKLGDPHSVEVNTFNTWSSFFQTMNSFRIPLPTMILDKTGDKFISKVGEASGDHKLVQKAWGNRFISGNKGDPTLVVRNPNSLTYLDVTAALTKYPSINKTNIITFLNDIGIPLERSEDVVKEMSSNHNYDFGAHLRARLVDLQRAKILVNNLYTLFNENIANKYGDKKNESSRYDQLARLQARHSGLFSEQVSTVTGDTRSEYSLNQSITTLAKDINNSETFSDLLNTSAAYLDRGRSPWARSSKRLNSLYDFENGGIRRKSIVYQVENLNGITLTKNSESTDIGAASSSADQFTKFIMDIHLLLQRGSPENPRHGEKSTSISTYSKYVSPYSKDGRLWMDVEHFLDRSMWKKIYDSAIPYLYAEHERVMIMRNLKPGSPELDYPEYVNNGKNFQTFDNILSPSTKKELYNIIGPLDEFLSRNTIKSKDLVTAINTDFQKYYQNLFDQAQVRFSKAGFIADNVLDSFTHKGSRKTNPFAGLSKQDMTSTLLKAFEFNTWIHNMESMIMHYGDSAQYKTAVEFNKRISMFSSTGDIFRSDNTMMRFINQNMGMQYAKSLGIPEKIFTSELGSAVMADPTLTSIYYSQIREQLFNALTDRGWAKEAASTRADNEGKAYTNIKIGDAQGWITFDSYRALKKASDKWSDLQEGLYQKIVQGARIDPEQVLEYFPVAKYQYAGPLKTNTGLPVMAGHKYSLFPLIPTVIDSSPVLKGLHQRMMVNEIDYALLHSGSKITTKTNQGVMDKFYSDFEKRDLDQAPFTKNTVYLDFLKDQQNVTSKYKGKATIATQMRKVIEEGLYENGKPVNQRAGELVKAYEKSINELTAQKKKEFIKSVGWDTPQTYGTITEKLLTVIDRELARQNLSDHEREAIQLDHGELKYGDLSYHLSSEKIEKVLSSMVNRILVRQKINGEPLVQVSGIGWESETFRLATPEERLKYGSNDLKFYQYNGPDKPTSAAKCKIALIGGQWTNGVYKPSKFELLLQLNHMDGLPIQTRERLNESVQNEEWLNIGDHRRMITIVGPRIPVEEQNSMEFEEVWEFLPTEAGNIIVHPIEIVAKTGSDFDVDKVTMMFSNLFYSKQFGTVISKRDYSDKELRDLYEKGKKYLVESEKLSLFPETGKPSEDPAANNLLRTIFGYDFSDLDSEVTQMLLEEKKLTTFEEFAATIRDNNNVKQAENEYILASKNILADPLNFAALVRPNGTFTLDPIADKLRDHVSDYDPKYRIHETSPGTVSFSSLMEYGYNLYVHQINKVSQEALAIAAVDNTANVNFNRVGAHMSYSYLDKTVKSPISKAIEKRITLHLPHNKLKDNQNRDVISLSHLTDSEGKERISGNIAQMINLLLEIAKNDSAYYLQLNREVIPTLLFLQQAGVPIEHLIAFASQPIIRQYMDQVRLAHSPIADAIGKAPDKPNFFKNKARGVMLTDPKYGFNMELYKDNPRTMDGIRKVYNLSQQLANNNSNAFDKDVLLDKITMDKTKLGVPFDDADRVVLLHWFEIEDMANAIRDIKMRLNFDTKRSTSAFLALSKTRQIELLTGDGRIPPHIVEGILSDSAISSLYIQPFMIDFLKPLFPMRADKTISNFLIDKMSAPGAMEDIESTFGDSEKFATRFFNDLASYIFQNKLRDFKIGKITKYRNMNTQSSLDVQQIPYLKFGAFVKDSILYYDMDQIIADYSQRNFTNKSYTDRGLATITQSHFKTAKEFYNFVFEREYIRSYTPPSLLSKDTYFKRLKDKNKGDVSLSYEEYIRDRALDNIGNGNKIFQGDNTYADQVMEAIDHYELIKTYPILGMLTSSESKGRQRLTNLQLLDTDLTSDKVDAFHQVLKELADPAVSKTPDTDENLRLSELFNRFPMVAFLQSGLSTSGSFSLVRLVPDKQFLDFMHNAVKEFTARINEPRLQRFYESFITQNTRFETRSRYKDYTAADPGTGVRPVTQRVIPVFDTGLGHFTYNPAKLNERDAKITVDNNPELIFIYDKSVDKTGGIPIGSSGQFASKLIDNNRTLGLPTLTSYAELKGRALTDKTLENNKLLIDQAVDQLKDLIDSGLSPAFSTSGYGQGLINLKQDGTPFPGKEQPGLKTFLYLSEKLFTEFGYVNKNYDIQIAPSGSLPLERVQVSYPKEIEGMPSTKLQEMSNLVTPENEDFITDEQSKSYGPGVTKLFDELEMEMKPRTANWFKNNEPFSSKFLDLYSYDERAEGLSLQEFADALLNQNKILTDLNQLSLFEAPVSREGIPSPQQVLSKNQPVSDDDVRNLIRNCL